MKKSNILFILITSFSVVLILVNQNTFVFKEDISEKSYKEAPKSPIPNDLWYEIRSYPNGFDTPLFLEKMALVKADAAGNIDARSVDLTMPWLAEGPGNIGGRFNVIRQANSNSNVMYAGAANGGLFKTTDNSQTWVPVFDDFAYLAIGSMAISPLNDDVLYVGTGDKNFGGGSKIGNGIYKSGDAGSTWTQIGLEQTGVVTDVVLHPTDSNIIYASTLGNPYEKSTERGVYKSTDAGQTWNNILFLSDSSGVIDLVLDPSNPDVLYASGFNRVNLPTKSLLKGPEADVYKTIDGGATWNQLTAGLPSTEESRVGLALSESNTNILYAVYVQGTDLEIKDVYKSTDAGANWTALNVVLNGVDIDVHRGFGWYFGEVYVNPFNSNHVIIPGVEMFQSLDGGQSWNQNVPDWFTYEVHADKHDVLFLDSNSYIIATDGGLYKTTDNGLTWVDIENIPVTQFYHVAVNPHIPFTYGGGAQDNGTMEGSSFGFNSWERLYGGDGFRMNYLEQDPSSFYAQTQRGNIRFIEGGFNNINVSPDLSNDRTNWDTPYIINELDAELFVGTSKVSLMEFAPYGNYQPISGDLTKVALGTHIGAVSRHTITEIEQAYRDPDILMVGTSDGLVWRGDRDNSGNWSFTNVTTPNLPNRYVTGLESSPDGLNFYITYSGYSLNDYSAYIYKTEDLGQTWIDISGDMPAVGVNDICIIPNESDQYLFAAVDGGVYFTENAGSNWNFVGVELPFVTSTELRIDAYAQKLICGTYSRSMFSYDISWINNLVPQPSAVNEQSLNSLKLFPNPSENIITIQNEEAGLMNIYNASGKLLRAEEVGENETKILNVSELPLGVYFYRINDKSGKFVKK